MASRRTSGSFFGVVEAKPAPMKNILLVLGLAFSATLFAQVGDQFPLLSGETLSEEIVTIPADTRGKYTLVALASSEKAEEFLRGWYEPVYNHFIAKTGMFDDQFDVNVYFVPMFTGGQKIGKNKVMNSMKKESKSDELFAHVLFYEGDLKEYQEKLKMTKKDLPYIFLIDPDGEIAYSTSGYYNENKMDAIDDILID